VAQVAELVFQLQGVSIHAVRLGDEIEIPKKKKKTYRKHVGNPHHNMDHLPPRYMMIKCSPHSVIGAGEWKMVVP
jgi:hypothetical protein